jgi:beta-lactamase class A
MISRREATVAGAMLAFSPWQALAAIDTIGRIEQRLGGRVGIAARDLNSGRKIEYRSNERFAMCSTFKARSPQRFFARSTPVRLRFRTR